MRTARLRCWAPAGWPGPDGRIRPGRGWASAQPSAWVKRAMAIYALKRFGAVLLILVVMSVLVFLATHALPANTAALILGQYSTPETQAALEHKLGLDLPLPVQFWYWARGILVHDNLGQSLIMERPIAPLLWDALGRSAILAVAAMAVVA